MTFKDLFLKVLSLGMTIPNIYPEYYLLYIRNSASVIV